jgi:hypothetical protein
MEAHMKTIKEADLKKALRLTDGDIRNMRELLRLKVLALTDRDNKDPGKLGEIWNVLAENAVPRTSTLVKLIRITIANSIELE